MALSLSLAKALPKAAILVALFIQEHGNQPIGRIAEVCGISVRSTYDALRVLKKCGLQKTAHDHDLSCHGSKGTLQETSDPTDQAAQKIAVDPLQEELVELGIFPQVAARIIERTGREEVEKQIRFHRFRLENGYKFRKAPAAMLYAACMNPEKYAAPPEGLHSTVYKAREGIVDEPRARTYPTPQPTPVAEPLSEAEKLEALRKILQNNPFPDVARRNVRMLATQWGIDPGLLGIAV